MGLAAGARSDRRSKRALADPIAEAKSDPLPARRRRRRPVGEREDRGGRKRTPRRFDAGQCARVEEGDPGKGFLLNPQSPYLSIKHILFGILLTIHLISLSLSR